MGLRDDYDFETLVNEAERFVLQEMERQLEGPENVRVCRCEDCILDMAALALNSVRPIYRVSLLGGLYAGVRDQGPYGEEVRKAVETAIRKVGENPSHG